MVTTVTFGSQEAARQIRENPQFKGFLADADDARETTVRLKDATPQAALDEITGMAADSKSHEADKAGQVALTRKERKEIDFSQPGVNVPKVRSIKGIATNEGVSDFLSFADLELTVDENREILREAATEEKGRRGLGREDDSDAMVDKKLANAFTQQQNEELDRAKDFALVETDDDAQEFVSEQLGGIGAFDIAFNRENGRLMASGTDFDRLEQRHENRSERAQTLDEKKTAPITRNPIVWANNPSEYDYPGIDTVQPNRLHEQRSEQAQETDENELAPPADSKQQWALNPDQYDWPGVDTPPAMGLGPTEDSPEPAESSPTRNPALAVQEGPSTEREKQQSVMAELQALDVSLSPDEAFRGVGTDSMDISATNMAFGLAGDDEADTAFMQAEEQRYEDETLVDDRATDGQLTDFGMETDATQHRESRMAEEVAETFGVDDRDDASRGAENKDDNSRQGGFEEFGGGVRENETLF